MDNTPYQDKVAEERIGSLSKFMEDVQFRTKTEEEQQPYFRKKNKKAMTLDSLLENIEEADDELDIEEPVEGGEDEVDSPEGEVDGIEDVEGGEETPEMAAQEGGGSIHIGPRQRYFIGASNDPKLAIVSRDEGDRVYYYTYPFKKEQFLKREIFSDLAETGSRTWLKNHKNESDTDLYMSIDSVLRGRPGERVSIDDFKFSNIQIKYIGKEQGDNAPWKTLEAKYNINVDSVLTNKQIYNVRLTNYDLNELEDKLDETPIDEREFKIIKIVKEDIDFFLEAAKGNLKPSKRELLAFELDSFKSYLQSNITEGTRGGDFVAGETIRYKNDMYIIVDFNAVGDTVEDIIVTLVKPDFTEVIEPVKLTDLKKVHGHELTGKTADDAAKTEKLEPVKFPESGEDGITKDQKALKEEKVIMESSVSTLIKFINSDADLYKGRYSTVADNLKKKKEDGTYDAKLATQAFLDVAERGARKWYSNRAMEFSASDMLLKNTADALRKEFEKEAHLTEEDSKPMDFVYGIVGQNDESFDLAKDAIAYFFFGNTDDNNPFSEGFYKLRYTDNKNMDSIMQNKASEILLDYEDAVNSAIDSKNRREMTEILSDIENKLNNILNNKGMTEDDEQSLDNEALPFSDAEIGVFQKYESFNRDAKNMVSYTWNSGEESGKNVKVSITKKQRPQQKDTVYTSKSIYDNNENLMDTGRTKDSAAFRTDEDLNVLESFISSLSLNEDCGEVTEDISNDVKIETELKDGAIVTIDGIKDRLTQVKSKQDLRLNNIVVDDEGYIGKIVKESTRPLKSRGVDASDNSRDTIGVEFVGDEEEVGVPTIPNTKVTVIPVMSLFRFGQRDKNIKEAEESVDTTGLADIKGTKEEDVDENELAMGIEVEFEHTKDKDLAKQIALDHLSEIPDYYTKLKAMEADAEGVEEDSVSAESGGIEGIGKIDCEPELRKESEELNEDFFGAGWEMWKALLAADLIWAGIGLGAVGLVGGALGLSKGIKNIVGAYKLHKKNKATQERIENLKPDVQKIIDIINNDSEIKSLIETIKNGEDPKKVGKLINARINEIMKDNKELEAKLSHFLGDTKERFDQAGRTRYIKKNMNMGEEKGTTLTTEDADRATLKKIFDIAQSEDADNLNGILMMIKKATGLDRSEALASIDKAYEMFYNEETETPEDKFNKLVEESMTPEERFNKLIK